MSKHTVSADGGAMPVEGLQTRRAILSSIASAGALVAASGAAVMAAPAASTDAELLALEAEIRRLNEAADYIGETCVKPFEDEFWRIVGDRRRATEKERLDAAAAFVRETGRDAAIDEQCAIEEQADALFARMMAIPAATQTGRAAKVRALLVHVMRSEWRGPATELDWEKEQARALLGQFAGMSADELAAV
jgi:hypothetical protein